MKQQNKTKHSPQNRKSDPWMEEKLEECEVLENKWKKSFKEEGVIN